MTIEKNFEIVVSRLTAIQKHCKVSEKNGKKVAHAGADVWNKAYAKRNDINIEYDKLYLALCAAHSAMTALSAEVKDLKANSTPSGLKETIKEAMTEVLEPLNLKNTYADVIKKTVEATQDKIVEKTKETLSQTLDLSIGKALQRNQQEIIEETKAKTDCDNYEKQRKVRNAVIKGVEESQDEDPEKRKMYDLNFVEQCGLNRDQIVRVFRAGRKETRDGEVNTRRPMIITFTKPEIAADAHNFGMGIKVRDNIWINPDLTAAERTAAYRARQARISQRPSIQFIKFSTVLGSMKHC